jgi:uncharacterized protein (TIGR02246 family)
MAAHELPVAIEELPAQMRAYLAAYHAHDPKALAELYAPKAVVSMPGVEFSGRSAIEAMWVSWFTALPDVASDVLRVAEQPGVVIAEWEERGTHTARLKVAGFDLPASGRTLCWRGATVYAWGDDGFERVTYYFDRLEIGLQLGTVRGLPSMAASGMGLLRAARGRRGPA